MYKRGDYNGFFFTCCFCFLDKTGVNGISAAFSSYSRIRRHNSMLCCIIGLMCVSSCTTKTMLPFAYGSMTFVTIARESLCSSPLKSGNKSVSTWNGDFRGLDSTSSCATNCWTNDSSLAEAGETKSTEKSCTPTCATEDERKTVASGTQGTTTTSRYSGLDCSTISEYKSTCATWATWSKIGLVDRAPWGISSVTCCTSKLKESEAESMEVCAAWGVSSKALEEPIPSGFSRGFYPCFCLFELTGFLPL